MDGRPAGSGVESRALTGLRGLAALLVMLHHLKLRLALDSHVGALQSLLQKGYLGVDLFFVLSGFVLAMTYGSWFDGTQPQGVGVYARFVVRRVARLWPLHAAVLLAFVVLGLLQPQFPFHPHTLLANFALVQAWGLSAAINPPAWSVSTEMFAYTVFPLLSVLALKGRVRPVLCCAGIVAALAIVTHAGLPLGPARRGLLDVYFNYSWLPVLRCLAGFTAGMLAWRAGGLAPVRLLATRPWVAPATCVAVLALMMGGAGDLVIFPLLPVVVLSAHHGRGALCRALGTGAAHRLGVLSYATYLTHLLLLDRFPFGTWPPGMELPAYLLLTLAVGLTVHGAIEVPGRRLVRAWGERGLDRLAFWWRRFATRPLHDRPG